ncbi:hypothetical protein [Streptomyces spirodelae]|uniref:Uncharacterized protein n=1 Tax=Streptomyces spirodelae TaxID=2812904 RepID=A0ABS3WPQ8_9ACTN|nr:hypothetical protein [Streptomyces spirodelae]MBO8185105.1 hypothetical protein [Streptomyces spirodelae]
MQPPDAWRMHGLGPASEEARRLAAQEPPQLIPRTITDVDEPRATALAVPPRRLRRPR